MDVRTRYGLLTVMLLAVPAAGMGQSGMGMQHRHGMGHGAADTLPAEVTPQVLAEGQAIFTGKGLCFTCHNIDGTGNIGPNLTDDTWLHGMGAYQQLVHHIDRGFDARMSRTGIVMPPRGGAKLSDAELAAVAAYVWTLSHPARAP